MKRLVEPLAALCLSLAAFAATTAQAAQVCGNGVIEHPETCDDGNTVDGDGCANSCGVDTTTLALAGGSLAEGNAGTSNLPVTVTRSAASAFGINFGLRTAQDTALDGSDYEGFPDGQRYFLPPASGSVQPTVPLIGDLLAELDESFGVELYGAFRTGGITMDNTPPAVAAGDGPIGMVVTDLTADGKPDVATSNLVGDTVTILTNASTAGTISLGNALTKAAGNDPYDLAAGDLTGDGLTDLVVANRADGTITVLAHTASPTVATFENGVSFIIGSTIHGVAVGDVSGDGIPDVVVTQGGNDLVTVMRNTRTTSLSFNASYHAAGDNPQAVALGDLDADGKLDLVVGNRSGNTVSLLRNLGDFSGDGSGAFAAQQAYAAATDPLDLALADFNDDGRLDIVVGSSGQTTAAVLLNTFTAGNPLSVAAPATFGSGSTPGYVAADDMDGDGLPDLVVVYRGDNVVKVFRNTSSGSLGFDAAQTYGVGSGPYHVGTGDLDGDAQTDFVVAINTGDTVKAVRNNRPLVGITTSTATATILNDDEPMVAFADDAAAISETAGTTTIDVTLQGVTDQTVNVSYALGGTATQGADYTISPATLSFAPGDTSKTLTISGLADAANDGVATETLVITLQDPSNAGLNPPNPYTLTITSNSNPAVVPDPDPTPTEESAGGGGGGALDLGLLALLGLGALRLRCAARSAWARPASGRPG